MGFGGFGQERNLLTTTRRENSSWLKAALAGAVANTAQKEPASLVAEVTCFLSSRSQQTTLPDLHSCCKSLLHCTEPTDTSQQSGPDGGRPQASTPSRGRPPCRAARTAASAGRPADGRSVLRSDGAVARAVVPEPSGRVFSRRSVL